MQDVDNTQDEPELQCYGFFRGSIVGIQYYNGQVNQREVCCSVLLAERGAYSVIQPSSYLCVHPDLQMVNFVREPDNPYDRK